MASFLQVLFARIRSINGWLLAPALLLVIVFLTFIAADYSNFTTPLLTFTALPLLILLLLGLMWLLRVEQDLRTTKQPVILKQSGRIFGIAVLVFIAATTLYSEFDGLLYGFHRPGELASDINTVTTLLTPVGRRTRQIDQALRSWKSFMHPQRGEQESPASYQSSEKSIPTQCEPFPSQHCAAPLTVLTWALIVDTVALAPAYGLILGLLVVWSSLLRANFSGQRPTFHRWQATHALYWVAIAVAADWLENAITLDIFVRGWNQSPPPLGFGPLLLFFVPALKWLGIFLVALYLLREVWLYGREHVFVGTSIQTIIAMRVPILLIGVFYVATLVHEQVPDIVRRLADPGGASIGVGIITIISAHLFAISIWYSSSWMLKAHANYKLTGSAIWLSRLLGLGGLLCLGLAGLNGFNAWRHAHVWGWKPLLPFLLALLFWRLTQFPNWLLERWDKWVGRPWDRGVGQRLRSLFKTWSQVIFPPTPLALLPAQAPTTYFVEPRSGEEDTERLTQFERRIQDEKLVPQIEIHGPRLLGSAVLVILAVALLKSTVGLILYNYLRGLPALRYAGLVVVALGLLGGTGLIYWAMGYYALHQYRGKLLPERWRTVSLILLGCVGGWGTLIIWWLVSPNAVYAAAPRIGSIAMLDFNLLLINLILCAVIAIVNHSSQVAIARLPVLTMLFLWFLLASALPPHETLHDVLARPTAIQPNPAMPGQDIRTLFEHWRCRNGILPAGSRNSGCLTVQTAQPIPLILIATAGGGIRAAVWTAYVLDRVIGYDTTGIPPINRVFAISSVSGGSLGVASYIAHSNSPPPVQQDAATAKSSQLPAPCTETTANVDEHWVCAHLGSDAISPALSWLTFIEIPWSLLRFDLDWNLPERDRARILEESWERAWPEFSGAGSALAVDLFELEAVTNTTQSYVPLLVFNGTTVESGCRMNTSILKSNGHNRNEPVKGCLDLPSPSPTSTPADRSSRVLAATVDLLDFLCQNDKLSLSKAVLLSARFPLISPSGHITQCPSTQNPTVSASGILTSTLGVEPLESYVVDGGYLENSGADTALELWSALQPLVEEYNKNSQPPIIPFFIQIDNGYDEPATPGAIPSQLQLLVPFTALGATLNGHEAMTRQAAEMMFHSKYRVTEQQCFTPTRYAHFIPQAHPGVQAPLGWVLSQESFYDLRDQFVNAAMNQQAKATVQSWFTLAPLGRC